MLRTLFTAVAAAALFVVPAAAATLDQMAGQMIVVGFRGDEAEDALVKALASEIGAGTLGGVMYLKTNVTSLKTVREMNRQFLAANPQLPPFITVDQEGGVVERLTKSVGFTEIPGAAAIAGSESPAGAKAVYAKMASGLAGLGFTVNFGPVADLAVNPANTVIVKNGRSFGKDGDKVAAYDKAFIDGHHQAGLITSLKHFPGHGSSTGDSHAGFVDITKTWNKSELQPYRTLFATGYSDFVMVGHLYDANYAGGSATKLPASLSPEWIDGVLRGELKFKGVVISDDLEMGAIRKQFGFHDTIVKAVNAGVDVLLFSNTAAYNAGLADKVRQVLVDTANVDPAFRAKIEASYARIKALKARINPSPLH